MQSRLHTVFKGKLKFTFVSLTREIVYKPAPPLLPQLNTNEVMIRARQYHRDLPFSHLFHTPTNKSIYYLLTLAGPTPRDNESFQVEMNTLISFSKKYVEQSAQNHSVRLMFLYHADIERLINVRDILRRVDLDNSQDMENHFANALEEIDQQYPQVCL